MSDGVRLYKQMTFQIAAGGAAGFLEVVSMFPLDVVKTRFQIQRTGGSSLDPNHYTSLLDCFRKMYKHEGILSFWKGILPPVIVETPKRAVKFLTFEQYKRILTFSSNPTPLTFALAGLFAGLTEAVLVNPFEVVKVELQTNRELVSKMPSTWLVTKHIVNTQGLWGLNKGLTATMGRHGLFTMIYFGFYHSIKGLVPEPKDPHLELLRRLAIGLASGTLGTLAIPFDVAKSRIQGPQPVAGQIKYKGTIRTICLIYREESFFALFKGFLPVLLRLGPGGAIMLVSYEYIYDYLWKQFP